MSLEIKLAENSVIKSLIDGARSPLKYFDFLTHNSSPKLTDETPAVLEPTVQTYNVRTDGSVYGSNLLRVDNFCPNCGKQNCFVENDGWASYLDDYGPNYYCFDCRLKWTMPSYDEDNQFVVRTKLAD